MVFVHKRTIHSALCSLRNSKAESRQFWYPVMPYITILRFITISSRIGMHFKSSPNRIACIEIEYSSSQIESLWFNRYLNRIVICICSSLASNSWEIYKNKHPARCHPVQWRRSVVKSEGSGSLRLNHQTRSCPKFVFVFGAEMGYLIIFDFFRFRLKMNFHFCFIFRFRSKNVIRVGPKMLCSQLNRN